MIRAAERWRHGHVRAVEHAASSASWDVLGTAPTIAMASFLTSRLIYLHLPKTGGTWLEQAAAAAGVHTALPQPPPGRGPAAHGHAGIADVEIGALFSVAFVRHPLDWWRSYWGDRMRRGWQTDSSIDMAVGNDDFNEFILRALGYRPGWVDTLVSEFVGSPSPRVDFVGRFECLVDDACAALRAAGETFDETALRAHPRANASEYRRFPALFRPEVAAALAEAERETIERFYADDPVPAAWLLT